MSRFLQSLSVAAFAWRSVATQASRPVIWLPFLGVACVQAVVLVFLVWFHAPALRALGIPLVKLLGGEGAIHYPGLFYQLPVMFFRANLVIGILITSLAGGVGTLLFARHFGLKDREEAWKQALRSAPTLIGVTLVMMVIIYAISRLATLIPLDLALSNPTVRWGTRATMMGLFILIQTLFAYTTAWIVLMGSKAWPAMRDSVRVAARTFLPTLLVVGVPAVLLFPFSYVAGRVDFIGAKLRPELIGGLLSLQVIAHILFTFLLVGAVTRLFLWRMEATR